MRQALYFLFLPILFFTSCNKDEGLGGSSAIEGYIYNIFHNDDNFSFSTETIPAVGEKVYIVYGDDSDGPIADKDVDTNKNGMYRFEYLRKGNYTVYALSSYPEERSKQKVAELKTVKVGSGTAHADTIYIHSGKAYGLSMIKGSVYVQYYDKLNKVGIPVPAVETRVYLKRKGEITHFDDVRVGNEGTFIFQKVPPGIYEVYTTTEPINIKNKVLPTDPLEIEVIEAQTQTTYEQTIYEQPIHFDIISNI